MENNSKGQSKGNKMFFVAVVVSLSMIILACIIAYPQVISPETENQLAEVSDTTTTDETTQEYNPVGNIVTNVPKTTTATTTTETTTPPENVLTTQATTETPIINDSPIMPLAQCDVINDFSNGELVKSATSGIWQTHNGVDLSASVDTAVQAVADGTVTKVYEDALLGICVTIDHTDFTANYCNLGVGVIVIEGDTVEKGSIIATVGDTSTSESALDSHLHFETIKDGNYINPLDIIGY